MLDNLFRRLASKLVVAFLTSPQIVRIIRIMNDNDKAVYEALTAANARIAAIETKVSKIATETSASLELVEALKVSLAEAQGTPPEVTSALAELDASLRRLDASVNAVDEKVPDPVTEPAPVTEPVTEPAPVTDTPQ